MEIRMPTHITETPAAPSDVALRHFREMLAFETDWWDVHESLMAEAAELLQWLSAQSVHTAAGRANRGRRHWV